MGCPALRASSPVPGLWGLPLRSERCSGSFYEFTSAVPLGPEAIESGIGECLRCMWLHEQCGHFAMFCTDATLDLNYALLELRHAHVVREFQAQGNQYLIRRELHCQHAVDAPHGRIFRGDVQDR